MAEATAKRVAALFWSANEFIPKNRNYRESGINWMGHDQSKRAGQQSIIKLIMYTP